MNYGAELAELFCDLAFYDSVSTAEGVSNDICQSFGGTET
jgi:hypothetical protein